MPIHSQNNLFNFATFHIHFYGFITIILFTTRILELFIDFLLKVCQLCIQFICFYLFHIAFLIHSLFFILILIFCLRIAIFIHINHLQTFFTFGFLNIVVGFKFPKFYIVLKFTITLVPPYCYLKYSKFAFNNFRFLLW